MVHNPKQQLNNFGSRIHACKMNFLRELIKEEESKWEVPYRRYKNNPTKICVWDEREEISF